MLVCAEEVNIFMLVCKWGCQTMNRKLYGIALCDAL